LFIEMITRYLTGMGEVKEDIRKMPPVPTPRAGMIYLMNPQFFVGLRPFKKSVSKLSNRIKKSKRKKGVTEIFIPGEQSSQKRMRAIKNGTLDVNEQVWDDLQNLIVKK